MFSERFSDSSISDTDTGNTGWADSIAKVLHSSKPRKKKALVLSRAKKIQTSREENSKLAYSFEIQGEAELTNIAENKIKDQTESKKPKNNKIVLRNKPNFKDLEKEKALKNIATRGVVQLFNAIRSQQKYLDEKIKDAGPLDHKKDSVLQNINKEKFLSVLMSGKRSKSEALDNEEFPDDPRALNKRKKEWNVLSDDFMTNRKLKNWDEGDSDEAVDISESEESDHE